MSLKQTFWVLDRVEYCNDPKLPTEVRDAIDEIGPIMKWGNDGHHKFRVDDFADEDHLKSHGLVIYKFLKDQGAEDNESVLISYWW